MERFFLGDGGGCESVLGRRCGHGKRWCFGARKCLFNERELVSVGMKDGKSLTGFGEVRLGLKRGNLEFRKCQWGFRFGKQEFAHFLKIYFFKIKFFLIFLSIIYSFVYIFVEKSVSVF